nr:hypothetical protein [Candidatus Synechococcus spongiarum]
MQQLEPTVRSSVLARRSVRGCTARSPTAPRAFTADRRRGTSGSLSMAISRGATVGSPLPARAAIARERMLGLGWRSWWKRSSRDMGRGRQRWN